MGRGPAITIEDVQRVIGLAAVDPMITPASLERSTGRHHQTCAKLLREYDGVIQEYRSLNKREIIEDIDSIRRAYLARVADPEVISRCSGPQATWVFGVLTDKHLLLSGRPTSITLGVHADVDLPGVLGRLKRAIEGRQATTSSRQGGDE